MPSIPRRLPPTPEERLAVITTRMAGGSNAGSTRWAQPLNSSNYRAQVAENPQAQAAGGTGTVIGQHVGVGTGVSYICNLPVAVGTQWVFSGTIVLVCNPDLPTGTKLLSLQPLSVNGSVLSHMTCLPSQFASVQTSATPYDLPGQNVSLRLNSTAGDVVTFYTDGTAPPTYGFETLIQLQGIVTSADSGGVDDRFVIDQMSGDYDEYNNLPAFVQRAAMTFTQCTDEPQPLDTPPPPPDDPGDVGIS